jgi:hypothetical protein
MPTPGNIFGAIVFGAIGMAAFVYGKRSGQMKPIVLGIALMAYPYFISSDWLLYLIGGALTASLYIFRE